MNKRKYESIRLAFILFGNEAVIMSNAFSDTDNVGVDPYF